MSQLSRKYSEETGDDPIVSNNIAYSARYVNWLEAKVEKLTASNKQSTPCCVSCGSEIEVHSECDSCRSVSHDS